MVARDFCELLARLIINIYIGKMLKIILCQSSGGRVEQGAYEGAYDILQHENGHVRQSRTSSDPALM